MVLIVEKKIQLAQPVEFLGKVHSDMLATTDYVREHLFDEEIFVFTPKGDVIQLASGATPLDFAFAVHSDNAQNNRNLGCHLH